VPDTEQLRREQALSATRQVALAVDLDVTGARVIKDSNNTIVLLPAEQLVSKVSTSTLDGRGRDALERELRLGQHLARHGAAIAPPARPGVAGPHEYRGVTLTFWCYYENRPKPSDADAALGGGAATRESTLDVARAVVAAALCGVAEEAFARTLAYLKERKQFERRIGSFQALQHRAARTHIEIENSWSATLKALESLSANANSAALEVAVAKAKASETTSAATAECLQMHGGIGMTDEFDIGLFLKRARVDAVMFGDAAFHADRVATMLGY